MTAATGVYRVEVWIGNRECPSIFSAGQYPSMEEAAEAARAACIDWQGFRYGFDCVSHPATPDEAEQLQAGAE